MSQINEISELSSCPLKGFRKVVITLWRGLTNIFANNIPETSREDILDVVPDVTRLFTSDIWETKCSIGGVVSLLAALVFHSGRLVPRLS
jgi:hypothetical protein